MSQRWTILCDFQSGERPARCFQGAESGLYVQRFTLVLPRNRRVAVYVARQTFASRWERGRGDGAVDAEAGWSSERRGPCIQFVSFLRTPERIRAIGEASNTHA